MNASRSLAALVVLALVACRESGATGDAGATLAATAVPPSAPATSPSTPPAGATPTKKPVTDLNDPSWYACTSNADCVAIQVGTSCGWSAVRADLATSYQQVDGALHANQGAGPGCMHPQPKPTAVCTSGRCATVAATPRR
jgi:hypothetical protein